MVFWILLALLLLVIGYFLSSYIIETGYSKNKNISDIKDEMEVRKLTFNIISSAVIVFTLGFTLSEFALKQRAEDRQILYGALGQLIDVKDDDRPEISAAALLQFSRLGDQSPKEVPALIRIVAAYLNERAQKPIKYHESQITRSDIQIALLVLSDLIGNDINFGKLVVLRGLDFRYARLEGATFPGVRFIDTNLSGSTLAGANLSSAQLTDVALGKVDFSNVDVTDAKFQFVKLQGSDTSGTNFCLSSSRIGLIIDIILKC